MKPAFRFIVAMACGLLLLCPGLARAEFRAAIAVRVVTPDPLLPVSGGVGASSPVSRKDGEITVRALVLADDRIRVAIVSTDFLGFPATLGNRARARVQGIPPENILIAATHTHSAPDPYGFPDASGRTDADLDYLRSVADRVGDAINEAAGRLQPARVRIASGPAKGKIAWNAYAESLFDPTCNVLQFVSAEGRALATLVNYAVHPEVLGSRAGTSSPDLVGPLYDRIAERGGGTGIFINGALGGMVTADNRGPQGEDISTWQECVRIGNLLADEALRLVSGAQVQAEPVLECRSRKVLFPVESPILLAVLKGSPMGYATDSQGRVSTQLNYLRLGDAEMLSIPGEALPNVGMFLRRQMKGKHKLLLGLTNDAFGYILAREDFGAFPRYEYISRTSLGERTAGILVAEALGLAGVPVGPGPGVGAPTDLQVR